MIFKGLLLSLILLTVSSCASIIAPTDDKLCNEIIQFANSQKTKEANKIILKTCWSCDDSIMYKHCESGNYKAGNELCEYLLKSASSEFPQDNLTRSLKCLTPRSYSPISNAFVKYHRVTYDFISIDGVNENTYLTIEYSENDNDLPTLTIESTLSDVE